MIVDAHVHLLPDRLTLAIRRFFTEHVPSAAAGFLYPHSHVEARQAILAAGIERCWSLPYVRRAGAAVALNRWMAETYADDPAVVPGGTVHPDDDVDAVLREALDELGLRLLKLHCSVGSFTPDDPRLDGLWSRVSTGGQPVVVHVGHSILGVTTTSELETVARVAERWPDARIVIAHCGAPAVGPTLALLRGTRSVYADLTPVVREPVPLDARSVAGLERRLLFGTDAPNVSVSIESSLARVRAWGLAPPDEAAVLGGNAEALIRGV
jgi:predicted TIM-barrel fold metal-dependent hydrolase